MSIGKGIADALNKHPEVADIAIGATLRLAQNEAIQALIDRAFTAWLERITLDWEASVAAMKAQGGQK